MTRSISAEFEHCVARNPHTIAVRTSDGAFSYDDINRAANRLARSILSFGLEPEARISFVARRSVERVIVILSILKSGAACVPLDCSYPQDRIQFILRDSHCRLLLVGDERMAGVRIEGMATIRLDSLIEDSRLNGESNLSRVDGSALAYVLYTSGSTGQPKGVLIEHRGVVLVATAMAEFYSKLKATRIYQFFSLTFDMAAAEIFISLFGGIELFVDADGPGVLDANELLDMLCAENVDCLITTPSYLMRATPRPTLRPLIITVCGEYCPPELARQWSKYHTIINAYGPTEITCIATMGTIHGNDARTDIGSPLPHIDVLLFDEDLTAVRPGEIGEIYIGGPSVARGYLGRRDLTQGAFIPSVSPRSVDRLMYKTGDLGRLRPDGRFEYLGRIDDQVKIQGFRIEPGEIEAHLLELPEISAAAVVAAGEVENRILGGFVVLRHPLSSDEIKMRLRQQLPPSFIPYFIESLSELPLLPSGKVDRRQLAAGANVVLERRLKAHKPASPDQTLRSVIAEEWCKALQCGSIQDDDNFFALGGESIRAGRIIAATRHHLGIKIPLRTIFDNPTLKAYMEAVERLTNSS